MNLTMFKMIFKLQVMQLNAVLMQKTHLMIFAPNPGKITGYRSSGGLGVRLDSGYHLLSVPAGQRQALVRRV